mmetsp:Transcript_70196/g.196745  ORF Transcript_70196/g.196745 Transcript_70196/m.196745 type:complete len:365 (-) Transcript_70196:438-1532(-)
MVRVLLRELQHHVCQSSLARNVAEVPSPKVGAIPVAAEALARSQLFELADQDLARVLDAPSAIPATIGGGALALRGEAVPHPVGVLRVGLRPWIMVSEVVAAYDVAVPRERPLARAEVPHVRACALAVVEGVANTKIHPPLVELGRGLRGDDVAIDAIDAIPHRAAVHVPYLVLQVPQHPWDVGRVDAAEGVRRGAASRAIHVELKRRRFREKHRRRARSHDRRRRKHRGEHRRGAELLRRRLAIRQHVQNGREDTRVVRRHGPEADGRALLWVCLISLPAAGLADAAPLFAHPCAVARVPTIQGVAVVWAAAPLHHALGDPFPRHGDGEHLRQRAVGERAVGALLGYPSHGLHVLFLGDLGRL